MSASSQAAGTNKLTLAVTVTTSISVCVWIKVNGFDKHGFDAPVTLENAAGTYVAVGLGQDANGAGTADHMDGFHFKGSGGAFEHVDNIISATGVWTFFCAVMNGTTVDLYWGTETGALSHQQWTGVDFSASGITQVVLASDKFGDLASCSYRGWRTWVDTALNSTEATAERDSQTFAAVKAGVTSDIRIANGTNPETATAGTSATRAGTFTDDASNPSFNSNVSAAGNVSPADSFAATSAALKPAGSAVSPGDSFAGTSAKLAAAAGAVSPADSFAATSAAKKASAGAVSPADSVAATTAALKASAGAASLGITVAGAGLISHVNFPLSRSSDVRYLKSPNGVPFQIRGDGAWSAAAMLTIAEWRTYLDDRKARGFNTAFLTLFERKFNNNANATLGQNRAGDKPFTGVLGTGRADFTTPNPAYWAFIVQMVAEACGRGMLIFAFPTYLGSHADDPALSQGIYHTLLDNGAVSVANVQSYGTYLATLLKDWANVILVMGGDLSQTSLPTPLSATAYDLLDAFTDAYKAVDSARLITAHFAVMTTNEATPGGQDRGSWEDLNLVYAGDPVNDECETAYGVSGPIPAFLGESYYEGNHAIAPTPKDLRAQAWQAVLSGAIAGHVYGNEEIWGFNSGVWAYEDDSNWAAHLNDAGTQSIQKWVAFMASIAWHTLVPDQASALVTSGRGTAGTANYVTAAKDAPGALAVAYIRAGGAVNVAMGQMGGPVTATWLDPSTGTTTPVTGSQPFTNSGTKTFTPISTTDGDIVLLLTAEVGATGNFSPADSFAAISAALKATVGAFTPASSFAGTAAAVGAAAGNVSPTDGFTGTTKALKAAVGNVSPVDNFRGRPPDTAGGPTRRYYPPFSARRSRAFFRPPYYPPS